MRKNSERVNLRVAAVGLHNWFSTEGCLDAPEIMPAGSCVRSGWPGEDMSLDAQLSGFPAAEQREVVRALLAE